MTSFALIGIQAAAPEYGTAVPVGKLVSGIWQGTSVIALAAHDQSGQYYIVLNGPAGQFTLAEDTGLTRVQEIPGQLQIEPAEGSQPFALPQADSAVSALVLTDDGDVGLRLVVEEAGAPSGKWVVSNSLKTGDPISTGKRMLLKGFKLSLAVEGRDKPLFIGTY